MITRQFPIVLPSVYPLEEIYDLNKIAFFDIETTGLSADTSFLYLIGVIYYQNQSYHLIQWFSEHMKEESLLLCSFFNFLADYDVLFHYNGNGFDLPFLLKKCSQLHLDYSFDGIKSIDLYKKISSYKKILQLKSYRQKAIEEFLRIKREDIFDGGDLIGVYQSYLGKKRYETLLKARNPELLVQEQTESEGLLHQLFLHNEDDLKGLVQISLLLYLDDLFEKPVHILKTQVLGQTLHISFQTAASLPFKIEYHHELLSLVADQNQASLTISIYEGELKYFYDNYRDYYYLPAEDSAIHKSLASYVDKEHRKKATPSNCYTRKTGTFAPQFDPVITPYLKEHHQDKLSYVEIHMDYLLKEDHLERYVAHILSSIRSR